MSGLFVFYSFITKCQRLHAITQHTSILSQLQEARRVGMVSVPHKVAMLQTHVKVRLGMDPFMSKLTLRVVPSPACGHRAPYYPSQKCKILMSES